VLAAGVVAAVAFPVLMVVREHPLVPPALFRRREFTTINLSTFVIYGALYVSQFLVALFVQGALGYTAFAAALVALPMGVVLALGSTSVGTLAGRIGVRPFLVAGPLLMAASQLWLARIPSDSAAWTADPGTPASWIPPASAVVDVLLPSLVFGLGLTLVVAPLTTALMNSIPVGNAGIGSAINNAISRVGQPLVLSVLFVIISAAFYDTLASEAPGLAVDSADVRDAYQPLNPAPEDAPAASSAASAAASTTAFSLAMLATTALLAIGAVINAFGLRRASPAPEPGDEFDSRDDVAASSAE